MAKVTSKLQVTIPKAIASDYGIEPGDEIDWIGAGAVIHLVPPTARPAAALSVSDRLALFDRATRRQEQRQAGGNRDHGKGPGGRGWTREDLYDRGRSR